MSPQAVKSRHKLWKTVHDQKKSSGAGVRRPEAVIDRGRRRRVVKNDKGRPRRQSAAWERLRRWVAAQLEVRPQPTLRGSDE